MKKMFSMLYVVFILWIGFSYHSGFAEESTMTTISVCTQEWAPVCGQPPMSQCWDSEFCIQMMPAPKTYGNKCHMYAEGAEFLYEGECTDNVPIDPICPLYDIEPNPPEGCYYEWIKDENGCKKPVLKCNKVCPDISQPEEREGCILKWYTDEKGCKNYKQTCESTMCTKEYKPVCGYKTQCIIDVPMSTNGGTTSGSWVSLWNVCQKTTQTFSNKCMMNSAGYSFLQEGSCEDKVVCPQYDVAEPKPGCYYEWVKDENGCKKPKLVCKDETKCRDYSTVKLMQEMNGCPLTWYVDENGCKAHKYECSTTPKPDDKYEKLKLRLANAIGQLFKKLENSERSNEEKINYLEKLIVKLTQLQEKKPKYEEIIQFVIDLIEEKILELQEDDGFDDIFEILQ